MQVISDRDYSALIDAAMKRIPCDLTVKNVRLVNVLTGEIYPASVDVKNGVIVHVQPGTDCDSSAETVYDGQGRYLMPGFIDIHMHIESSMLTPENFGREAILHGTTSVMVDPHEIGNVCGLEGIRYMVESAGSSPVRQFNLAPSCIPSDTEFETAPYPVLAPQMKNMLETEGVYGIAEVMDANSVILDKPFMRDILQEGRSRGTVIQGHCPGVNGRALSAYRLSGVSNTHTASTGEDVREYLRAGMHVNMQSSSLATMFGLKAMLTGLEGIRYTDFLSVCTDDVHAKDMHFNGHISAIMKQLLSLGTDPVDAVRWCCYNPARETGFEDLGAVAPGYAADFQLVDELDGRDPYAVFVGGKQMVEAGKLTLPPVQPMETVPFGSTVNVKELTAEDCMLAVPEANAEIAVVECEGRDRFTFESRWEQLPLKNGCVDLSGLPDYCYVAVFNRFGTGKRCIAVYHGYGLKEGAMATTISHDCHNIVVAYRDPADAAAAVNRLRETGGGILAVRNGKVASEVQLPVAGLMSVLPCGQLVEQLESVSRELKNIWQEPEPSLLKLSLLALVVLPGISMTDTCLVNGSTREKIPAWRRK